MMVMEWNIAIVFGIAVSNPKESQKIHLKPKNPKFVNNGKKKKKSKNLEKSQKSQKITFFSKSLKILKIYFVCLEINSTGLGWVGNIDRNGMILMDLIC